jgi:hypothetical protein
MVESKYSQQQWYFAFRDSFVSLVILAVFSPRMNGGWDAAEDAL